MDNELPERPVLFGQRAVSPVLVGRDRELAAVVSAVSSPPAVVVLEGEAGVGKTRLTAELLAHPEVATRRRLVGRCHPIRESFPLGAMIEALQGLRDVLADLELSPVTGALRPLLPELADVWPPALEPLDDRLAERHRVFRGFAAVLAAFGPTVLVLDDLHWADDQTLDFITFLEQQLPAQLSVVLAYRTEEAAPAVRALAARPPAGAGRAQVRLDPLDSQQTGELVAGILGADRVSAEFASYLWERTSGLPFAIEELLALARSRGLVADRDGRWERRTLDQLEVPRGIRDSTLEHVSRLPAGARRLAEAAAVVQIPADPQVLATVAETAVADIDEAVHSGLIVEHGDQVSFRHQLAAQSVYDDLSTVRRRELHARAATVLRELAPQRLGQIAYHLKRAGRLPEWAVAAEAAADRAVELANDEEAFRLLDDVLRSAQLDPDPYGRLAAKLGRVAHETLQSRSVVDLLSGALERRPSGVLRGELRLSWALALNQYGEDLPAQLRLLSGAVDDLAERPELRATAVVVRLVLSPRTVPLSEDLDRIREVLQLVEEVHNVLLQAWALGHIGTVLVMAGEPSWRELLDRLLAMTSGKPQQRREVNAFQALGRAACIAGHLQASDELLSGGLDARATRENNRLAILLRSARASLDYARGEWDGLAERVQQLLAELSNTADVWLGLRLVSGQLALAHGDLDEALRLVTEVRDTTDSLDDFHLLPTATAAAARAAVARGDVDVAVDHVLRCVNLLRTKGVWAPIHRLLPTATEVLVAAGRSAQARELLDQAAQQTSALDVPLAPAALRYAEAVLASSGPGFAAAADLYERRHAPYEAALAREQAARCYLAVGNARQGEPLIARAVAAYERLGASWDRGRIVNLARQHGLKPPAARRGVPRGDGTRLSPREQQVAGLAAAGRTNSEIAAELFVSKKTVEKQLSAAMRKLHVRSRVELAATWHQRFS
jgi:DNA-binding CsgD family transcriptional regulator